MQYEENPSEPRTRVVLFAQVLFSFLLASLASLCLLGLSWALGWDKQVLAGVLSDPDAAAERWQLRFALGLNHLCVFVLAGYLTLRVAYGAEAMRYLQAERAPKLSLVGWGILLLVSVSPMVLWLLGINQALPLPEMLKAMETQTEQTVSALLRMNSPLDLMANLTVIAILPAIGEELVFRGVLQGQLMRRLKSPWAAILIAAAIFSAIHLQFGGFLPRMALGVALGWLYWRTGNFWVPVAAHFFNNAAQIAAQYLFAQDLSALDLEKQVEVPWYVALVSLTLALLIAQVIQRQSNHSTYSS